jgi:hypothetical protein
MPVPLDAAVEKFTICPTSADDAEATGTETAGSTKTWNVRLPLTK